PRRSRWPAGPRRTWRAPAHGWSARPAGGATLTPCGPALFLLRRGVGVDHRARLELVGIEDDLLAGPAELLHVRSLDALVLDLEHPRLGPLPVLPEADLAHDGAELVRADVVGYLLLVEALGPLDAQPEDLHRRVRVGRQVVAEGVDPRLLGALLVLGE